MKKIFFTLLLLFKILVLIAQTSVIKGTVKDATNNETIPFANVFIEQINLGND